MVLGFASGTVDSEIGILRKLLSMKTEDIKRRGFAEALGTADTKEENQIKNLPTYLLSLSFISYA
jgi:hypothetical protein